MTERKATPIASVIAFGLVACVLYGLGAGLRGDIGILLLPLAAQCGIDYADVSFCIAVMQITFGAAQPFFGMLASRRSNRFVLVLGVGIIAVSLVGMAFARSFAALLISLGFGFGIGIGALGFGLILSSAINFVGPERAMMISGILNAAAGMLAFILSPLIQWMLTMFGTMSTLLLLLIPTAALVPIAFVVTSRDPKRSTTDGEEPSEPDDSAKPMTAKDIRDAFRNRTFRLTVAAFSTCGFHMVIIESHLFNQFASFGIDPTAASWAFSVYGIATVIGALLSGWLSSQVRKGRLLGFYYGFRAVWVLALLLLMPKTLPFAVLFVVGLGMTGGATVSPTSGLVGSTFPLSKVATLVGVAFFCHQIGAFLSAWLGGVILDATGSYDLVWTIDIVLCTLACIMCLRIREE